MPEPKPIDKKTARHIRALVVTKDDALKGRPWRPLKEIKRALKASEITRAAHDADLTHDPKETPMALIFSTTPHDTDELIALRQIINDNERAFSELRTIYSGDQRRLSDEWDTLMAAQRPTYPTPEQLQALDMITEKMRAGTEYGDHLGSPRQVDREAGRALPHSFDFSSFACRINIRALAPYRARSAQRAWEFSDDDIQAFRDEVKKRSLGIASHWQHEDGVAFQVFDARV